MEIIQIQSLDGSIIEQVKIDNSDGSSTVMPKDIYDRMIAEENNE